MDMEKWLHLDDSMLLEILLCHMKASQINKRGEGKEIKKIHVDAH